MFGIGLGLTLWSTSTAEDVPQPLPFPLSSDPLFFFFGLNSTEYEPQAGDLDFSILFQSGEMLTVGMF